MFTQFWSDQAAKYTTLQNNIMTRTTTTTIEYINYYYFILAAVKRRCSGGFTPILKHLRNPTRQSHTRVIDYLIYII